MKAGVTINGRPLHSWRGLVGAGWWAILNDLAVDLFSEGWKGKLWQVKEKFGGLRFYTEESNDIIDALIDRAEERCWRTCEDCGSENNVSTQGSWLLTLCDWCRERESRVG